MTKPTPEDSTRFVFKSSPEAFISPLFFKNKFTLGFHLDFDLATPLLCIRHHIPVRQHIGQGITATSRHRRDMTSDVYKRRLINTNSQTNIGSLSGIALAHSSILSRGFLGLTLFFTRKEISKISCRVKITLQSKIMHNGMSDVIHRVVICLNMLRSIIRKVHWTLYV